MNRIELEIKKDEMIKTVHAVHRMKSLTKAMTDSYYYINQVVGFMVFDSESNIEEFDETQIVKLPDSHEHSQLDPSDHAKDSQENHEKPAIPAPDAIGSAKNS